MKIHVFSDLHIEFATFVPDPAAVAAADVIVLAGDIGTGTEAIPWARKTFAGKRVIYIAGNHEFYGHHWTKLLLELRDLAAGYGIHFLENDGITIDGVRFLGCTLWTDFDYFGRGKRHQNMLAAEKGMNDFRSIAASTIQAPEAAAIMGYGDGRLRPVRWSRKLTPVHTLGRHQASLVWLKEELPKGDPERTVVITHHFPHKNSCNPVYSNDPLTAIYGSHVDGEVLLGAKLWVHGHTHASCNYRVGDSGRSVQVVCNPRGYPLGRQNTEFENASFEPGLLIDFENPERDLP